MVMGMFDSRWQLRAIDLVGGGVAALGVAALLWSVVLRPDRTSAAIQELSEDLRVGRQRLAQVRAELQEQRSLVQSRRAQLDTAGKLPEQTRVEEYFQVLSGLATSNSVTLLRQNPLTSRLYPGLLERRYAYEVSGSAPDLVRFLKAIEESKFWADVSYLTIDQGVAGAGGVSRSRVARLTISLFSAPTSEQEGESG